MVVLFLFELIEGNTVTRLYFMGLRRLTREALRGGDFTPKLHQARGDVVPTSTHFLDLPLLLVIVALGATMPTSWTPFLAGSAFAVIVALALTWVIPRLYPWGAGVEGDCESSLERRP